MHDGIEMDHLRERMDTGVGSPRAMDTNRVLGDRSNRTFQMVLNRLSRRLALPPVEPIPRVCDQQQPPLRLGHRKPAF